MKKIDQLKTRMAALCLEAKDEGFMFAAVLSDRGYTKNHVTATSPNLRELFPLIEDLLREIALEAGIKIEPQESAK